MFPDFTTDVKTNLDTDQSVVRDLSSEISSCQSPIPQLHHTSVSLLATTSSDAVSESAVPETAFPETPTRVPPPPPPPSSPPPTSQLKADVITIDDDDDEEDTSQAVSSGSSAPNGIVDVVDSGVSSDTQGKTFMILSIGFIFLFSPGD